MRAMVAHPILFRWAEGWGFSWVSIWHSVLIAVCFCFFVFLLLPFFSFFAFFSAFVAFCSLCLFPLFDAVSPLCCFLPSALSCCLAFVLSSPASLFFNFYALMFSCVCSVMLICFLCLIKHLCFHYFPVLVLCCKYTYSCNKNSKNKKSNNN